MKYTIFLLFFSLSLFAQENVELNFETQWIRFPFPNYYIEKIIDARPNKDSIGIFFKQSTKKKIVLKKSLEEEVSTLLLENTLKTANRKPMILKINHLFMTDKRKGLERFSYIELGLSFIVYEEDGSMQEIFVANHTNIRVNADGVYKESNFTNAFDVCINDCARRQKSNLLKPRTISTAELNQPINEEEVFGAVKNLSQKKGLFLSFYDFRDGTIDTTISYDMKFEKVDSINYPDVQMGTIKMVNWKNKELPWAYSDGKDTYVNIEGLYFKLDVIDKKVYLVKRILPIQNSANMVYVLPGVGFLGGLLSAAASVAINEIIDEKTGNTQSSLFSVNMKNGIALPIQNKYYNKFLVLNRKYSENIPVTIEINGKKARVFNPGECFERTYPLNATSINVCAITPNGQRKCAEIVKKSPDNFVAFEIRNLKDSLGIYVADTPKEIARYSDEILYKLQGNSYKNITIKDTHFKRDTSEVFVVKTASSPDIPSDIFLDDVKLCSIGAKNFYKFNVINVEQDPKICFVENKYKRKRCLKFTETMGASTVYGLDESTAGFTIIEYVPKAAEALKRSIYSQEWIEACPK